MSVSLLLIGTVGVFLAAFLGGVTGFGYALVSVPFLLLAGLPLGDVVVINMALVLLTRVAVLWQLRADVDRSRAGLLLAGGVPSIAAGYALARGVDAAILEIGAGGVVLLLALVALVRDLRADAPKPVSAATVTTAGGIGGLLGATTSLNGVVPALALRGDNTGPRSYVVNLAVYFVVTNAITLTVLLVSGLGATDTSGTVAACWLVAGLVGNQLGIATLGRVREVLFHRITLGVAIGSGVAALVRSVLHLG